jgi:hypothetical protein
MHELIEEESEDKPIIPGDFKKLWDVFEEVYQKKV